MDVYNQLALVEFKDNVTDLINEFLETREDGTEVQEIRDLKSYVFYEVLKVFYNTETIEWIRDLEDNV